MQVLHKASMSPGGLVTIDVILGANADIHAQTKWGATALNVAISMGNCQTIGGDTYMNTKRLLELGLDPNNPGDFPLPLAPLLFGVRFASTDLIRMLVNARADVNIRPPVLPD